MSSASLEVLKQYRDALLLAEVAGLLHDMGKCTDDFIRYEEARGFKATKSRAKKPGQLNPHKAVFAASDLSRFAFSDERRPEREEEAESRYALHRLLGDEILQCLEKSSLTVLGCQYTIRELIYFGRPGFVARQPPGKEGLPADYLGRCHGAAHVEKEEKKESGSQTGVPGSAVAEASTVFGVEIPLATDLTNRLRGLPFAELGNRNRFQEAVSESFAGVVADTRRPENEVTLWNWADIVAALYKAALAGALLGYQPNPNDLRWRLLSVRVDSATFVKNVARIPDLLARQGLLRDGFERVRRLLEETYPLATRVYQDQDNSIYIVPNVANLLDATDAQGQTLSVLIRAEFEKGTVEEEKLALKGEVIPAVQLDTQEWQAQRPDRTFDVPPIAKLLKEGVSTYADHHQVTDWWRDQKDTALCPVCRLRPMKEGKEACETCLKRHGSRIAAWLKNPGTTIWMDEIADANDRVALIVGKFGLDDWLSGEMVQTLLVKAVENDPDKCVSKNPSPARLRRVWETTQRFWTETVEREILDKYEYGKGTKNLDLRQARVLLIPHNKDEWQENVPYDGTINGQAVSLLWQKKEERFVTISNLQLGAGSARSLVELTAAWHGQTCQVSASDKPGEGETFTIRGVELVMDNRREYMPYLSLLASPDQFLALVPAYDALAIVDKIRDAYQKQFGKVQNRLPLFLGLVFFPRKTPLAVVMDTARRMLEQVDLRAEETWQIAQVADDQVEFDNGVMWRVPTKMGDGKTEDVWYPYYRVQDETAQFKRCFDVKDGPFKGRWARITELEGKEVYVTPSRFAYLWLEHTAQRFAFDAQKDVMLLDELRELLKMWEEIRKTPDMTDTKLRGVQSLLQVKGAAWGDASEELRHLTETTLPRAGLWDAQTKQGAVSPQDVMSRRFSRCLELHTKILKLKIGGEK